jgi:hypothetical protein
MHHPILIKLKAIIFSLILMVFANQLLAQNNNGIFFQAVARDNYQNPAIDRKIFIQTTIIQSSVIGTKVLIEEHQTITDKNGIFSISIGNGTRIGGFASNLANINWSNGPYFLNLKIAITPISVSSNWDYTKEWVDLGTTNFGTVPYSLQANSVIGFDTKLNVTDTLKMLLPYVKNTSINTLSTSIASNTASITSNRASINTLSTSIASNTASITANKEKIDLKAPIASPSFIGSVALGITIPDSTAVLDINSTSQGILIPRMTTTQRNAILKPANTLFIFNTTNNAFEVYKNTCNCWVTISDGGSGIVDTPANTPPNVSNINYLGTFRVGGTASVYYTYSDIDKDAEGSTTIIWEIANDNNGTAKSTYSRTSTPIFQTADAGRYIRARVTPRSATGVLNGLDYYGSWTLIDATTVPYGSSVNITGNAQQGSLLTASYTFNGGSGIENTTGSTYIWQWANDNANTYASTISIPDGGTAYGKTIRPSLNEVNRYVRFGVRAKDNASVTATNYVYSKWIGPITLAAETAPVATNVTFSPAPGNNVLLNGRYTYVDVNNDPEATSLYQWYTATDASGANQTAISGATTKSFAPTDAQLGKYIGFSVTPIASTGTTKGTEVVYYNSTPSVAAALFTIVSLTQTSNNFYVNRVMDLTDYITASINVTSPGSIAFSTPIVNGYSFSNGGVYTTGLQNVILYANGTQTAYNAAGDLFTITAVGSSTQTSSITIKNTSIISPLANNAPTVSTINYRGVFRIGGTVSVVYTYADVEKDLEAATSITWEMATDNTGAGRFTYSTSATPTFITADGGKYVRAKITPRTATGILNGIDYYGSWVLIDLATKPFATSVNVSGITEQGSLLTASYTYNGGTNGVVTYTENTLGSTYQWQTATSNKGANTTTMAFPDGGNAFSKTIRPTINEVNKYIRFGVLAKDNLSAASTNYVYSDWVGPITLASEAAPSATNLTFSQAPTDNIVITGSYTYVDANNDPEGNSLYQWYTATSASGANKIPIPGQTSKQISITNAQFGYYIGFGVTAKALTGTITGTEVVYYNPTIAKLARPIVTNLSFAGTNTSGLVGNTLTGTYSYTSNGSAGTESETILKWYTASNATDLGTQVGTGGTYTPTTSDLGKYIIFEVTPKTSTGATGDPVRIVRNGSTQILDLTAQTVEAAYSLRKLRAAYTGYAIQVRRNGDNATQNIGFTTTGTLDETALTTFVSNGNLSPTNSGTVSIWYDQSGKGRDVSNTTTGEQPFIVTSGVIEKYNGVPTIRFVKLSTSNTAGQSRLFTLTGLANITSAMGVFAYTYSTKYEQYDGVVSDVSSNVGISGNYQTTYLFCFSNQGPFFYKNKIASTPATTNMSPISNLNVIYTESYTSTLPTGYLWNGVTIGMDRNSAGRNWGGPISEVILFNSRLNDNNYADVLTIQEAQMLYFQGK